MSAALSIPEQTERNTPWSVGSHSGAYVTAAGSVRRASNGERESSLGLYTETQRAALTAKIEFAIRCSR